MTETKIPLHELVAQVNKIHEQISLAGGELTPEVEQALALVDLAVATKIDSYSYIEKWLESQAEFYKKEADVLIKTSRSMMKARERLRDGIKSAMYQMGTDEVQGQRVRYKLAAVRPSLEINESLLPMEYKVITYVPDNARVRATLEAGETIPGAQLVPSVALRSFSQKQ